MSTRTLSRIRRQILLAGLLIASLTSACASDNFPAADSEPSREAASEVPTELDDGSYSCEAFNSTRANGPYDLECDKSGDEIVLHFNNGGYIFLDVESQDSEDGSTWRIEASHSETGDDWELTITK